MELLLILSALLAGLTGAFADDRRDARPQVETAGLEAVSSASGEALVEAAASLLQQASGQLQVPTVATAALFRPAAQPPVGTPAGASERRRE